MKLHGHKMKEPSTFWNMKKVFFILLALPIVLFAEDPSLDMNKISEAMGYLIGKNLEEMGLQLDANLVVKGIAERAQGKDSPMSEEECVAAITQIQEKTLQEEAKKNLALANQFLQENSKNKDIVEIQPGKLQYRVEKKGTGATVEP